MFVPDPVINQDIFEVGSPSDVMKKSILQGGLTPAVLFKLDAALAKLEGESADSGNESSDSRARDLVGDDSNE